uniref:Hypoxanthine phosphoribosyltransferase n=1 Tax=Nephromyces sp. MMRI TaxID=2496275 RepID=A0A3Q8UCE4_9APIC|nr:hypoxanthine-guanine phosphoribosyltransferase [Nephromyces sp. MMRI]AZL94659.1 hypoxanthine-guanine phosphoribosyltransferase [Nephromyces sp. MMRI]AZL94660.1 hypoxanthine-guanine phosphoribosyltransferase [Nephromyces sp. MMRI]AZL94661.1 hypoxanthine-guanine phosphoribosyltransferase [Nephromyces sp. MMRI]AZL94662.1 hypoxanthine-guanine phosphoribosyltransferase [Nephromyces sp. MMRI]
MAQDTHKNSEVAEKGYSRLAKPGVRSDPIYIEAAMPSKNQFVLPPHYEGYFQAILLSHGTIIDRIEKLAHDIKETYGDEELNLLCLLKGSRSFFTQLISFLNKMHVYGKSASFRPPYMEHYVRVKSYCNDGPNAEGVLEVISEDLSCLKGKNVLVVEDIIDTGNTLNKFYSWIENLQPKTITVAALLEKRTDRGPGFTGDFVGFSVPDGFLVGFSLDYNEMFRDLEHICVLNEEAMRAFSK